jgi:plastocyanin
MGVAGRGRHGAGAVRAGVRAWLRAGLLTGAVAGLAAVGSGVAPVAAQSTLERSPNVEGVWTVPPGAVQLNFNHRFRITDAPLRKVLNSPTFLVAAGLPARVVAGGRYASNSMLVSGRPNEWELFARWVPWRQEGWGVADVGVQLSHNGTAGGVDGEVMVGRELGPGRLMAGARAFSAFRGEDAAVAVVVGGALRLHRWVALAADVAEVVGGGSVEGTGGGVRAWSGGLQLAIPYSPHFLSLHVTNVNALTLQGSSVGSTDRRWGFEFTVPVTWSRYGGGREDRAAPVASRSPAAVLVEMDNRMNYLPDTVRVSVGERVLWRNTSDLVHTVTADPARAELPGSVRLPPGAAAFDSGDMRPGEEFAHVFVEPGEYRYFCVPHERVGMVGVVIVTP